MESVGANFAVKNLRCRGRSGIYWDTGKGGDSLSPMERNGQRHRDSRRPAQMGGAPRRARPYGERLRRGQPVLSPEDELQKHIDELRLAEGAERDRVARLMARHGRVAVAAVDRLLSSRDRRLRLGAALVLTYANHVQAVAGLSHALRDEDPTVRLTAAAGLGQYDISNARAALLQAFPDQHSGVSIAILRSMEKIMNKGLLSKLARMETSSMHPLVTQELRRVIAARSDLRSEAAKDRTPDVSAPLLPPLHLSPWLRVLPQGRYVGRVVPGTEDVAAAMLRWQIPDVEVIETTPGNVSFRLSQTDLPRLVQVRTLVGVWVALPHSAQAEITKDSTLINQLVAFGHAKALQSLIVTGDAPAALVRQLGQILNLRSARAPGNPRTLRLHVTPSELMVELLSPTDYPVVHGSYGKDPTQRALAATLCALTVSSAQDVFLDPFCNDGSVVGERGILGPVMLAYGCDEPNLPIQRTVEAWRLLAPLGGNSPTALRPIAWRNGHLPIEDAEVDAVATMLTPAKLKTLGKEQLVEIARVLRVGGRAAFLAPDRAQLETLLEDTGLHRSQVIKAGGDGDVSLLVATRA